MKLGDYVKYKDQYGIWIYGHIIKVYETIFGSKIKDIALQLKLDKENLGRMKTTIRMKNAVIVEEGQDCRENGLK